MQIKEDERNETQNVLFVYSLRLCFIFSLQINLTLTLPLWGGSTPGTTVEGVVDKDVALHAKELCTLRARIYLQENKRNTRIKMI